MAMTVADLLVRFGSDTTGADQGFAHVDGQIGRFQSANNSAFSSLRAVGTAALGVVGGGLLALGGGMAATAFSGLGLNSTMENVTAQLNAFTKDGAKSAEILEMIRDRAAKTPFEFNEMASAAAGLLPAAKASGQGLESLIEKAEILAASNPAEGLEGAAFALREAVSGDFTSIIERFNLPRQYINQLKEQGVPALEIVSRAMKEVGFDTDLVSNLAETASGRWSTFKDTFQSFSATITQPIFDRFSAGLGSVNGWLEANSPLLSHAAEVISGALGNALDAVTGLLPDLDTALSGVVSGFVGFVEVISGVVSVISEFISSGELLSAAEFGIGEQAAATADSIVDFALAIYDGVSAVMSFISPIASAIASFVSWQDVLVAVGLAIASVVVPAIAAFVVAWAPVIATVAAVIGAVALLRNAWESNFLGMRTIAAGAINTIGSLFSSLVSWLSPIPAILSDVKDAFAWIWEGNGDNVDWWWDITDGFVQMGLISQETGDRAADALFSIGAAASNALSILPGLASDAKDALQWIWEGQGGNVDWWWDITDGLVQMGIVSQETGDNLASMLFDLGASASNVISAFRQLFDGQDFQTLQSNVTAALGGILSAVTGFFSGDISLGGLASAVAAGFGEIVAALAGFFGGSDIQGVASAIAVSWNGLLVAVQTAWDSIDWISVASTLDGITTAVSRFFAGIDWSPVTNGLAALKTTITEAMPTLGEIAASLNGLRDGLVQGLANLFTNLNLTDKLSGLLTSLTSAITSIDWSGVGSALGSAISTALSPEGLKAIFTTAAAAIAPALTASLAAITWVMSSDNWSNLTTAIFESIRNIDWSAVGAKFSTLKDAIVTALGDFASGFTGAFETPTWISDLLDWEIPEPAKLLEWLWPELPEWLWPELPEWLWPELPEWLWPELPKWLWPSLPKWTWPSLPTWTWPAIPTPGWLSSLLNWSPSWPSWLGGSGSSGEETKIGLHGGIAMTLTQEFNNLTSKMGSVISGALSNLGGVNVDSLLPRQQDVNEDARRLASIAIDGFSSPWVDYFKNQFPDLWSEITASGDIRGNAAQILKDFQDGLRPELLDKDKAKELVRRMLLGEQNVSNLINEIASELASEMGIPISQVRDAAANALGGSGALDLTKLLPKDEGLSEAAAHLAEIALNGYNDEWVRYFKGFPEIFRQLQESGDIQSTAAQMLKDFQDGLHPELIDKEKAKELVRRAFLGGQNAKALIAEVAAELSAEMGVPLEEIQQVAQSTLGSNLFSIDTSQIGEAMSVARSAVSDLAAWLGDIRLPNPFDGLTLPEWMKGDARPVSGSGRSLALPEKADSGFSVATIAAAIAEAMHGQPLTVNLAFSATISGEMDAERVSYQMARRISDIIQRRAT